VTVINDGDDGYLSVLVGATDDKFLSVAATCGVSTPRCALCEPALT